jgi:vacuolar-type H+-ATPase subunit E/Vma4
LTGLETVRNHHLAVARERADALLGDARAQARRIVSKSSADAAALIEHAEKEGEEAAELDTSREWTAARRRARGIILAARQGACRDLQAAVAAAVRADPRYPALLERLANEARRRLGPGADVDIDTSGDLGVSATRKDRHIDWSLDSLVVEGIERLGPEIEELWR